MGITYIAVTPGTASTSATTPVFERDGENSRPLGGERSEAGGWVFGLVKNFGIVAFIIALIVIPKNFMRRKAVPARVK
jgi:hypothetical protein